MPYKDQIWDKSVITVSISLEDEKWTGELELQYEVLTENPRGGIFVECGGAAGWIVQLGIFPGLSPCIVLVLT